MYIKTWMHYCVYVYVYGWNEQTDDQVFTVNDKEIERERDRAE